jgi:endonuclease VIII
VPEGDTIYKLARALAHDLCGRALVGAGARRADLRLVVGRRVEAVDSHGKHLLVELDNGLTLRCHLGLYGSWHRYRRGESWRKPAWQASVHLSTADLDLVCFNAKEVEVLRSSGFRDRERALRLGPDLARESPDPEWLRERALALLPADAEATDLLLDQRVACGIGNVYKSEVLFICRCSPLARIRDLTLPGWGALYEAAGRMLRANLGGGPRTTRQIADGRDSLWVYGRADRPCFVCGEKVRRDRLGRLPRSTYWCPCCQSGVGLSGRSAL